MLKNHLVCSNKPIDLDTRSMQTMFYVDHRSILYIFSHSFFMWEAVGLVGQHFNALFSITGNLSKLYISLTLFQKRTYQRYLAKRLDLQPFVPWLRTPWVNKTLRKFFICSYYVLKTDITSTTHQYRYVIHISFIWYYYHFRYASFHNFYQLTNR